MIYFHVMFIFNTFILTHRVLSLPLTFSRHSLTTLNSIYHASNTYFFTILSPTYPQRSITECKIKSLLCAGMKADVGFSTNYPLSPPSATSTQQLPSLVSF